MDAATTPHDRDDPSSPNGLAGDKDQNAGVRYVLAGQPTGWAAMAAKVREYDEEKVKDTKEDIDTLLVFSGLFSAVLTAFLVESYQRLLPDMPAQMLTTSSQTLVVMQQISLQMADPSYSPVVLDTNATTQLFRPSSADIRVNVLWFSSLIFSLITASFGILIKQWLREYLAVNNPSPYGRLRIRHYRYPGLRQWQVFEIAAVLPLLQQLALALFFVGLCYFTASVHESIGHTSLPLVSGWAFCFSTVTILPAFFPRCPYKTTLLKSVFRKAHANGVHVAQAVVGWFRRKELLWRLSDEYDLSWLYRLLNALYEYVRRNDESLITADDAADLDILVGVDTLQSNDELLGTTLFESLQQIHGLRWLDALKFVFELLQHRLQMDNLLSRQPCPLDLKMLSHSGYNGIIDILSHYSLLHFVQIRDLGMFSFEPDKDIAARHVLLLLFSPSRYPLPKSGVQVLREVMPYHGAEIVRIILRGYLESSDLADSASALASFFDNLTERAAHLNLTLDMSLQCFEAIIDTVFDDARNRFGRTPNGNIADDFTANHDTLSDNRLNDNISNNNMPSDIPVGPFALEGDLSVWPWKNVWNADDCQHAMCFLSRSVGRALRHETDLRHVENVLTETPSTSPATVEQYLPGALACMWHLCYVAGEGLSSTLFRSTVRACLSGNFGTIALVDALYKTQGLIIIRVCSNSTLDSTHVLDITEQMLQNFIDVVTNLIPAHSGCRANLSRARSEERTVAHALKLLCLSVHLVQLRTALQHANLWKKLLHAIIRLVGLSASSGTMSGSALHHEAENTDGYFIRPMIQFIRDCHSTSHPGRMHDLNIFELTDVCLGHIKWQEFGENATIFDDKLIQMIGAIYVASHHFRVTQAYSDMSTLHHLDRLEKVPGLIEELRGIIAMVEEGSMEPELPTGCPAVIELGNGTGAEMQANADREGSCDSDRRSSSTYYSVSLEA